MMFWGVAKIVTLDVLPVNLVIDKLIIVDPLQHLKIIWEMPSIYPVALILIVFFANLIPTITLRYIF